MESGGKFSDCFQICQAVNEVTSPQEYDILYIILHFKWGVFMAMLCHTEYAVQKKVQIENGLLNLMLSQQYQSIGVTDICREAGIPRRTFYHYFENKDAVLDSIIEVLMQQCFLEGVFDFRLGPKYMERSFLRVFQFWEGENRKKLDTLMQNGLESKLMAWALKWIREEQMSVFLDRKLDPKLVEIVLMVGATDFFVLLFHWSQGGYQETPEEMAEYAVWALPHGLFHM